MIKKVIIRQMRVNGKKCTTVGPLFIFEEYSVDIYRFVVNSFNDACCLHFEECGVDFLTSSVLTFC